MTAEQYRAALEKLSLTRTAAARLLGVDARTSRRYARQGTHGAVVIVLKLLLTHRISAGDVIDAILYRSI